MNIQAPPNPAPYEWGHLWVQVFELCLTEEGQSRVASNMTEFFKDLECRAPHSNPSWAAHQFRKLHKQLSTLEQALLPHGVLLGPELTELANLVRAKTGLP